MKDINIFYRYAAQHFGQQTLSLFHDMNELYSMVNQVYTECIQRDPDCLNQFIINKIRWSFLDLIKREKTHRTFVFSLENDYDMQAITQPDFSKMQSAELLYIISLLEQEDKNLIYRYHYQENSLNDIAKAEGCSKATIIRRFQKIYRKLRKLM